MDKATVNKILRKLRKYGTAAQELMDDFVHDEFARQASVVNNQGMREQVEYLLSNGYSEDELTEQLER